jgi:hypothetical protein
MFEALVSNSLIELGIDQATFDAYVQRDSAGGLHRRFIHFDWSEKERFNLAHTFAKLAIWRIDAGSIRWESPRARRFFMMAHNVTWRLVVQVAICVFLALTFVEAEVTRLPAASMLPGSRPWPWWVAALEGCCACTYVADLALHLGYQLRQSILEDQSNAVRVLIACSCLVDYIVALAVVRGSGGTVGYLRWSRPLRLLYIPFTSRACFNSVLSILDSLPSLGDLALLAFLFTLLWTIIGASLFADAGLRGEPFGGGDSNSFDSFGAAFIALFTLMTGEKYGPPDPLPRPSLRTGR